MAQVLAVGSGAAQVFEAIVDGFGEAVGGVGVAEINQECPRSGV